MRRAQRVRGRHIRDANGRGRRVAVLAAVMAVAAAGCTGDDNEANATELSEALADQGEVVDDVEIRFADRSDTVSVGGLEVTVPGLVDFVADDTDIVAPPTWQLLDVQSLEHVSEPFEYPSITFAVFSQTVAVTADDLRAANEEQHWLLADLADVEPSHRSEVEGAGVTCHTEIRIDDDERFGALERGHVLFSGPGLASSAMVALATPSEPDIASLLGDAVESACRTRPEGL